MVPNLVEEADVVTLRCGVLGREVATRAFSRFEYLAATQDGGRAVRCAVWLDVRNGPRALDGTATLFLPADRQGHPAHSKEN